MMPRPQIGGYKYRSFVASAKRAVNRARQSLQRALETQNIRVQLQHITVAALALGDVYEDLDNLQRIVDDPQNALD
jgi:hypothetical protein